MEMGELDMIAFQDQKSRVEQVQNSISPYISLSDSLSFESFFPGYPLISHFTEGPSDGTAAGFNIGGDFQLPSSHLSYLFLLLAFQSLRFRK